jgi:Fe-Mn family superoxide dismutase
MAFKLPDLPFDRAALEPHMSAETLDFHHGKHHKAYVDKVNEMLAENGMDDASLVEIIRNANDNGDRNLFNNAAQIWNHSFFWRCLAPPGSTRLSGKLKTMVKCDFGSAEAMLEKIASESAGHFGSGWVWLVLKNGKLKVTSYHDADTPVVHALVPLLALDVWEHAYYIDYRNERPKFIKSVLDNLVNWDFVAVNLDGVGLASADQQPLALADA